MALVVAQITQVAEQDGIRGLVDQVDELGTKPQEFGGAGVHDEHAVLYAVAVRFELLGYLRSPDVV
nr:hypothetical protein [Phytohabitans suffuscus]